MAELPSYSKEKLERYFDYISLPEEVRCQLLLHREGAELTNPNNALELLKTLQQYQLGKIPFENLSLHYSPHHAISLNPDYLYDKIVVKNRGRGGYCMENNCFFGTILQSLGYNVCSVGGRVNGSTSGEVEKYTGWSHMVNLVGLNDKIIVLVDVGFGNNGPTEPMQLKSGHEVTSLPPSSMRLSRQSTTSRLNIDQHLWTYEHRFSPTSPWTTMYCFTEIEFFPKDYEVMNLWTSQSRQSWFTYKIAVAKMIMRGGELVGTLTMNESDVKRRLEGETHHIAVCETEEQRVKALAEVFEIVLTEEEKDGIMGTCVSLSA